MQRRVADQEGLVERVTTSHVPVVRKVKVETVNTLKESGELEPLILEESLPHRLCNQDCARSQIAQVENVFNDTQGDGGTLSIYRQETG